MANHDQRLQDQKASLEAQLLTERRRLASAASGGDRTSTAMLALEAQLHDVHRAIGGPVTLAKTLGLVT
jgi:hypothetical protein